MATVKLKFRPSGHNHLFNISPSNRQANYNGVQGVR